MIWICYGDVVELVGVVSLVLFVVKMVWKEKGVGDLVDSMFWIFLYYIFVLWFLIDLNVLLID